MFASHGSLPNTTVTRHCGIDLGGEDRKTGCSQSLLATWQIWSQPILHTSLKTKHSPTHGEYWELRRWLGIDEHITYSLAPQPQPPGRSKGSLFSGSHFSQMFRDPEEITVIMGSLEMRRVNHLEQNWWSEHIAIGWMFSKEMSTEISLSTSF